MGSHVYHLHTGKDYSSTIASYTKTREAVESFLHSSASGIFRGYSYSRFIKELKDHGREIKFYTPDTRHPYDFPEPRGASGPAGPYETSVRRSAWLDKPIDNPEELFMREVQKPSWNIGRKVERVEEDQLLLLL